MSTDLTNLITGKLSFTALQALALTSKIHLQLVGVHCKQMYFRMCNVIGSKTTKGMTIKQVVERVYHLNNYENGDASGIIIKDSSWMKGNNAIMYYREGLNESGIEAGTIDKDLQTIGVYDVYNVSKVLHRMFNLPALIIKDFTGTVVFEKCVQKGMSYDNIMQLDIRNTIYYGSRISYIQRIHNTKQKLHNLTGPAVIYIEDAGVITYESWHKNGKIHRPLDAGPACIERTRYGQIDDELYYTNNRLV